MAGLISTDLSSCILLNLLEVTKWLVAGSAVAISLETNGPTGGDISPDGAEILLRTYKYIYYWRRDANTSLNETLSLSPVRVHQVVDEPQGEAICWESHGRGFFTISEGPSQPLLYYASGPSRQAYEVANMSQLHLPREHH